MTIVDDPLLALIVRFVVNNDEIEANDEEFCQCQIRTLNAYVSGFPVAQQEVKALEWIEQHAEVYRRQWQKRVVQHRAPDRQCHDCPLNLDGQTEHCSVHGEWLSLLSLYSKEKLTSTEYVRNTLQLLQNHKQELKVITIKNLEPLKVG
ncbi:MAG: hypothetical protein V7752_17145 [Halopseudomonas sp.]